MSDSSSPGDDATFDDALAGPDGTLDTAPVTRRSVVMAASGLLAALLVFALTAVPAPYAIGGPGPTFDTLGEETGQPLVVIDGAPTYDTTGELRLTTVTVSRGTSQPFTMGSVLLGFVRDSAYVRPESSVFGTQDREQAAEESQQEWITSQERATVSALEALGEDVPAVVTVALVPEGTNAEGLLEPDDVLVAVDGVPIASYDDLTSAMDAVAPGADVTVDYLRGDEPGQASFATVDDGDGNALMGIWVDADFDLPIDVQVEIDSVGGPSAGLMFSLAIMDLLTERDALQGAHVAGTGTIDLDGSVGAIGGIALKMHGALDDGADYFLAPVANCDEVTGNIPDGLDVYAVEDLDDAYAAVLAIGDGETEGLATCADA